MNKTDPFGVEEVIAKAAIPRFKAGMVSGARGALGGKSRPLGGAAGAGQKVGAAAAMGGRLGTGVLKRVQGMSTGNKLGLGALGGGSAAAGFSAGRKRNQ